MTVGVLVSGFFVMALPASSVLRAVHARPWPQIGAEVTAAEFSTRSGSLSRCHVRYTHTADGRRFESTQIGFQLVGNARGPEPECRYFRTTAPSQGDHITISYNPRQSQDAVYLPQWPVESLRIVRFSLTGMALAAWWLFKRRGS